MDENPENGNGNTDLMQDQTATDFLVVGIGASAGGVQALQTFFKNVPEGSGNAYVVILHLSPAYESRLAEILQHAASIPVKQVKDRREKVRPDCVYVIPPNRGLIIEDGHLATTKIADNWERRAPVDLFFRTLAESRGNRAVSVVLTGTGPNGSMGIKRVKELGGVVFVQDPDEAEYPGMPSNSIATGLVDFVLPLERIPAEINEYKRRLGTADIPPEEPEPPDRQDEQALAEVFRVLRKRTGHDFANYKRATVLRRIERRMTVHGKRTLPEYVTFLREHHAEPKALLKDLLISVTNFFRDEDAFNVLKHQIIPKILADKSPSDSIRVWVAGCATGEEAYSIAILFAEQAMTDAHRPSIQIFATDIDEAAIARARIGLYSVSDVADVSPERLELFFQREGENYRVRGEIREMVLFAVHNVTKDPPFSRLDLATCRNLLIYLNHSAQARVLETLHFALNPGKYLFLGSSESADTDDDLFVVVDKDKRIYQSRPVQAKLPGLLPDVSTKLLKQQFLASTDDGNGDEFAAQDRLSYAAIHQRLLELYASPSIVVNGKYEIVHVSSRAGRYLQISGGEPSTNLLDLARPELRLELRMALYQAMQRHAPVITPPIEIDAGNGSETINLVIRPVADSEDPSRGFMLVIFEPALEAANTDSVPIVPEGSVAQRLEEELIQTKAQLRTTIEQYEGQNEELRASNEELQAINEELRVSTEELETGREELQSVNEELSTVNQELKVKIDELSRSNNDFENLMNSSSVATIFLDRALRVKMFTRPAVNIFSLIPGDIGRSITDLQSELKHLELATEVNAVLADLQPVEKLVDANDGRTYLMRISPYRNDTDRIDGVVVTLLDISGRLKMERDLRESSDRMNEVIDSIADAFYAVDADWNFIFVNRTTYEWTERKQGSLIGKNIWEEFPTSVGSQSYEMHQVAMRERRVVHFQTETPINGRLLDVSIYPDDRGGLSCYFRDISDRLKAETQVQLREAQLRMVLESATEYAIFTTDEMGRVTSWNRGAEETFGYKSDEMVGQLSDILFTPEDRRLQEPKREMETALETGRSEDERWHVRKDGSQFWASGVMQPLRTDTNVTGFVKICRDQTDKLAAEGAARERKMLQRLVTTQEDERKRIARDLHDTLGQQLTALRLKLEAVKANYGAEPAMIKGIDETQMMAKKIDDDVSFLTWELRPTALDNLGLRNALASYVAEWSKNFEIPAEFHSTRLSKARLEPEVEVNLYRIAQEALNNVVKHARAKKVSVLLEFNKGEAVLVIEDDGRGFNPKARARRTDTGSGLGLIGMRERASLFGGKLAIESARGKGTTVIARVPAKFVESTRNTSRR